MFFFFAVSCIQFTPPKSRTKGQKKIIVSCMVYIHDLEQNKTMQLALFCFERAFRSVEGPATPHKKIKIAYKKKALVVCFVFFPVSCTSKKV